MKPLPGPASATEREKPRGRVPLGSLDRQSKTSRPLANENRLMRSRRWLWCGRFRLFIRSVVPLGIFGTMRVQAFDGTERQVTPAAKDRHLPQRLAAFAALVHVHAEFACSDCGHGAPWIMNRNPGPGLDKKAPREAPLPPLGVPVSRQRNKPAVGQWKTGGAAATRAILRNDGSAVPIGIAEFPPCRLPSARENSPGWQGPNRGAGSQEPVYPGKSLAGGNRHET